VTSDALHGKGNGGWICTLPEGHTGEHIACGVGAAVVNHGLFRWPRTLKEEAAFLSAELLARGVKL
jgi:hypothetical protein